MDAKVTKSNETYSLINIETGMVEASGLRRIGAMDKQNILWASKIKTRLVNEFSA